LGGGVEKGTCFPKRYRGERKFRGEGDTIRGNNVVERKEKGVA